MLTRTVTRSKTNVYAAGRGNRRRDDQCRKLTHDSAERMSPGAMRREEREPGIYLLEHYGQYWQTRKRNEVIYIHT